MFCFIFGDLRVPTRVAKKNLAGVPWGGPCNKTMRSDLLFIYTHSISCIKRSQNYLFMNSKIQNVGGFIVIKSEYVIVMYIKSYID